MTKKLFWANPYQTNLESRVAAIDGQTVVLEETIFFAFSGGQESDSGTIGGYPVIEARKVGRAIEYVLPEDHTLTSNQAVTIRINWDRRYQLMRLHFAAELVLELMYKKLAGIEKVGAHIAAEKARIDFIWPTSIAPLLPELTAQAAAIVQKDLSIVSGFSDEQQERRYWQLEGFAKVPCGGTHLKATGEVGRIRLKRNNIGKGKERVEIYLQEQG